MNFEEGLRILDAAIFTKINRHLKDVEIIVLKGSWRNLNYDEIGCEEGYAPKYLQQDVGFKLWKLISETLGEEVKKANFRAALERLHYSSNRELKYISTNILPIETQQLDS
jgi:hypothetical protein